MGIGAVGSGNGSGYVHDAAVADAEEGAGSPAVVDPPSVADVAELMVEADKQQRRAARETSRALSQAAHQERRQAIAERREAAEDRMGSAVQQLCVGLGVAALQAVSAGAGSAAGSAAQGAAEAAQAGDAALQASLVAEQQTAQAVQEASSISADLVRQVGTQFDPGRLAADDHLTLSDEHSDRAQLAQDGAGRAQSDAEAARSARQTHLGSLAKALELQDRGMTIAIGREST